MNYSTISKRNESVRSMLISKGICDEDKSLLFKELKKQKVANYANKAFLFGVLFVLYKKNFFNRTSPYMIKEIAVVIGGIAENYYFEKSYNDYFWGNVKDTVRKYALRKEKEFFDLKNLTEFECEHKRDLYE